MPTPLQTKWQCFLLGLMCASVHQITAQNAYTSLGQPYAIAGALPGDQTFPALSIQADGGYLVWHDAQTDSSGQGISAYRLNNSLSGVLASFRVNEQGALDQEHPQVALLPTGGAVFVWQGGRPGFQNIYARFLAANGTFATGDLLVNTTTNQHQMGAVVAALTDGTVVVVWTKHGSGIAMQDVMAQRLSTAGQKVGPEFKVNRFDAQNQRTPAVVALANGAYAVSWVTEFVSNLQSEEFSTTNAVTANAIVYCRLFAADGTPLTDDVRASLNTQPVCANPAIASLPGGGFTVVWNQQDRLTRSNGWDIYARRFTELGATNGLPRRLNTVTYGDQFAPQIASVGPAQLVVWNSLGQDGSGEGVFGCLLDQGVPAAPEFLVNTNHTISRQLHPVVAADPSGRFLVSWSSFIGGVASFDLFAQRYVNAGVVTDPPAAPYAFALSPTEVGVSWPELAGFYTFSHYELFVDNNPAPMVVAGNHHVVGGLSPGTAYLFRLAYRFADGNRSDLSPAAKTATWGADGNGDGLPDSWQQMFWGPFAEAWPSPNEDTDQDGANNLKEFLTGTSPLDARSVLRTRLVLTPAGGRLEWNCEPGYLYQVQKSVNFQGWIDFGSARFAAGSTDSVLVGGLDSLEFYRVIRVR